MRVETVYKTWCPSCGKVNYVNNGDTQDCTVPDVEGVRCWSCKEKYLLDEPDDLDEGDEMLDDYAAYYKDGKPCLGQE